MSEPSDVLLRWQGKFLRILQRGHWEFADRVSTTGAVAIVAITEPGNLILTEQFRLPMQRRVVELPAGLAGDTPERAAEELAEAARRELLEETGYECGEMKWLAAGPPSAGLATETVAFFHATQLRRVHTGGGDAHEAIEVHEVSLRLLHQWLEKKLVDGVMVDPKIYAGLYLVGVSRYPVGRDKLIGDELPSV